MDSVLQQIEFLLLVSALVAMLARRWHVPYSLGLVAAGIILAFLPFHLDIPLTKELVFYTLLPPLIFEAAFYIHWKELKADLPVIGTFATLGLLLSAALTAAGMHHMAGWEWGPCLVFGALIAATDPVSVIATFKEAGVQGRLRLLVEAESLLNDGTAAVVFTIAVIFASGRAVSMPNAVWMFLLTAFGGIVCGLAVGYALMKLAGRTDDTLVEITFTMVAAYGSFALAERLHMSGVLASMSAGLLMGNVGYCGSFNAKGRPALVAFWEYAAFAANSLIFLLIGMHEATEHLTSVLYSAVAGIAFVILGRAVAIYPCALLFQRSAKLRVEMKHQHVLFWGGLRGALALALALGLPETMPRRNEIITVAFCIVAFSIFVQGMTMTPLLKWLGQIPKTNA